jgi:4a-hydroxytetrahydrobiopterin dehydratase
MTDLPKIKYVASHAGDPPVTAQQCGTLMLQLPGWEITHSDGIDQLRRVFPFKNFKDALAFTNLVGDLAERHDHHPELVTEWGKVTVTWWSHEIRGLHLNDFIMAAQTSQLL